MAKTADSARTSSSPCERSSSGQSGLGQEGLEVVSQEPSDGVQLLGSNLHAGTQVAVESSGPFINEQMLPWLGAKDRLTVRMGHKPTLALGKVIFDPETLNDSSSATGTTFNRVTGAIGYHPLLAFRRFRAPGIAFTTPLMGCPKAGSTARHRSANFPSWVEVARLPMIALEDFMS